MSPDELKEKRFDEMLGRALQQHSEPAPADFTDRMLKRIQEAEEQKILARVVMEGRLALAGCIVLGAAAIVAAVAIPSIAAGLTGNVRGIIYEISQNAETIRREWQFYMVFAAAFVFAVYSFVELLAADA